MKPTVAESMKRSEGSVPPGWCDASGQHLGWGATEQPGQVVACEVCGKRVKLRHTLSRTGSHYGVSYPRHKQPNSLIK